MHCAWVNVSYRSIVTTRKSWKRTSQQAELTAISYDRHSPLKPNAVFEQQASFLTGLALAKSKTHDSYFTSLIYCKL